MKNQQEETSKIKDEAVDEVAAALIAFFERKGGHTIVANEIGVNPQQLYYIITSRNSPTLKTVMRILRHYPKEVELRRALSLPIAEPVLADVHPDAPLPPKEDTSYWKIKCAELEGTITGMQGQIQTLTAQIAQVLEMNDLLKKLVKKLDPSFKESDSQITVFPMPRTAIGFVQQSTDCIVRMHPATAGQLRMLNSRVPVADAQG